MSRRLPFTQGVTVFWMISRKEAAIFGFVEFHVPTVDAFPDQSIMQPGQTSEVFQVVQPSLSPPHPSSIFYLSGSSSSASPCLGENKYIRHDREGGLSQGIQRRYLQPSTIHQSPNLICSIPFLRAEDCE
eukprot:IDg17999t1